jgi:hypothetical protein
VILEGSARKIIHPTVIATSTRRRPKMRLQMLKPEFGGNDQLVLESKLMGKK